MLSVRVPLGAQLRHARELQSRSVCCRHGFGGRRRRSRFRSNNHVVISNREDKGEDEWRLETLVVAEMSQIRKKHGGRGMWRSATVCRRCIRARRCNGRPMKRWHGCGRAPLSPSRPSCEQSDGTRQAPSQKCSRPTEGGGITQQPAERARRRRRRCVVHSWPCRCLRCDMCLIGV